LTQLQLKKDLVFFDIESTGLNVIRDRIVQIALIKYSKDGSVHEFESLINPGIPISEESMAIHGITPEDLKNKPTFAQIGPKIFEFIGDADLSGYNSDRFDVPMLMEELARIGLDLNIEARNLIDVQKIFYKMEPRTLKAAYQLYCGKELKDAHDALADVRATAEVFMGQLTKYEGIDYVDGDGHVTKAPIVNDISKIAQFLYDKGSIDVTQRLKVDINGVIVFNFGKYIGQPVAKTVYQDRQYFFWIQEKDFSFQVKKIVRKLLEDYEKELKQNNQT
jgi:DNA polymerase-3 subunit epsilon